MIDFIGDIHGYADQLTALLEKMGYSVKYGIYSHPTRKVVFIGDYIDRGPKIRETLMIVRNMVESGCKMTSRMAKAMQRLILNPMRPEDLAGRAGKQPDGSAKTREVKVCAVWSAEARDSEGLPMRDEGSVSYSAAIESAATPDTAEDRSAFAGRVSREASRRRYCETERTVVVADGAPWIWNIAQDLFPGAIQIVDRFHVKQTLHRTAQSIFGSTGEQAKPWAAARCAELDAGKLSAIVRALRPDGES